MNRSTLALAAGLLFSGAALSQTSSLQSDLSTLWEVMWHQSGMPVPVAKWDDEIRVYISGVNVEKHHAITMAALYAVSKEAGVNLTEVDDEDDSNVQVEITDDNALANIEPCVTNINFDSDSVIQGATVKMRDHDVDRCAYHESMHVMGFRGHPAGATVLSYFPIAVAPLLPLDKTMLRAWYAPDMKAGMSPFQAFPIMARELVCAEPAAGRDAAILAAAQFYAGALVSSRAYADGTGEIPPIVKRSGKSKPASIMAGRKEMSQFLLTARTFNLSSRLQCKSQLSDIAKQ